MNETSINGIDVSECPLYDKNTGCYHTFNGECVKDSCTVYKLLLEHKRLQEENEELKQEKYEIEEKFLNLNCKSYSYYKALEEIREKLKKYDANIGDTIIANPIQDCYDTYKLIDEVLK